MTDFSQSLIRCSALGNVMSNGQGKPPMVLYEESMTQILKWELMQDNAKKKDGPDYLKRAQKLLEAKISLPELESNKDKVFLAQGAKSFLINTFALEKYNRIKEVETKEMVKGILVEDNSIELFSEVEQKKYEKNNKRIKNEWVSGTPDLFDGETLTNCSRIVDIKSCWDIESFLKNVTRPVSNVYWWQIQGYLYLSGASKGVIAFCLSNTPDELIEEQKYFLARKMNCIDQETPQYQKECEKLVRNMTFDDIPPEERVLRIEIDRDDEAIDRIAGKVTACREYLAEFEEKHLFFTKNYRKEQHTDDVEEPQEAE